MEITNKVKLYRARKRLTQKELAKKSSISERQLIEIEKGNRDPRISTVLNIANSLDVSVEELFKLGGENSSSEKQ